MISMVRKGSGILRVRWAAVAALILVFGWAGEAGAHDAPLDRRVGWLDWNWDPALLLNLTLVGWLYVRGITAIWDLAGTGRVISSRQASAFAAGLFIVAVALLSPLDPLGEQLSWAHMVQHMILMTVAAPLVMLGAPVFVCVWGLSLGGRRTLGRLSKRPEAWGFPSRLAWNPLVVWSVYALTMWTWHLPSLYQAALRNDLVHDVQHLTFFAASCLFWRVLLDPISQSRLSSPVAVLYLFTTTLHANLLGVFLTIAPNVLYTEYISRTQLWGLTALKDQQIAGLIMWMPACAAYPVVAVALLVRMLDERTDGSANFMRDENVTFTVNRS